jgi:exopolysaccharide production protein ExoQ
MPPTSNSRWPDRGPLPRAAASGKGWSKARIVALLEWLLTSVVQGLGIPQILGIPGLACSALASGAFVSLAPSRSLTAIVKFWPLYFYVFVALLSVLWSDEPWKTLRVGGMTLFFTLMAIASAARVDLSRFLGATFFASIVVALIGLALGNTGPSAEGLVPIGLMGAKNGFSFSGQALLLLSLAVMIDSKQHWFLRLLGPGAVALSVFILIVSKSAGGIVSAGFGGVGIIVLILIGRMPTNARIAAIASLVVCAIPIGVALPTIQEEAASFSKEVLNKDTTLTGRTYIWEKAEEAIAERPILGHGFQAFWTVGNIQAEGIWNWAGLPLGAGFNFHNTFIEERVDMGYVGLGALILFMVLALGFCSASWILAPSIGMAWMLASMLAMFSRFPVEAMNAVIFPQFATWAAYGWITLTNRERLPATPPPSPWRKERTYWRLQPRPVQPG